MEFAVALAAKGKFTAKPNPVVGCVIVNNNEIVGQGYHQNYGGNHAEINAIENACHKISNYRLINASIYCTLEPCHMCASAIIHARISNLYYGASDMENEELQNKYKSFAENKNLKIDIYPSINEKKCSDLLINFFKSKRTK